MKKTINVIILTFILIFSIPLFSACEKPNNNIKATLTETEIIQEAKLTLKDRYTLTNLYEDIYLVGYIEIEENKVYVDWHSSNNDLINATNGKVNRDLNTHSCTLTAILTYNDITETLNFIYSLPAKKYENSYPSFSSSGGIIQFSVAYLAYDDSNNLTVKLHIYNNLSSKKTLYGIDNLTFSIATSKIIFNNSNYLLKDMTYTNNSQKQFTCKYGNYVTITLPVISNNKLSYESELARITNPIFSVSNNFTYYHS